MNWEILVLAACILFGLVRLSYAFQATSIAISQGLILAASIRADKAYVKGENEAGDLKVHFRASRLHQEETT